MTINNNLNGFIVKNANAISEDEFGDPVSVLKRVFSQMVDRIIYTGILNVSSQYMYIGFRYPYAEGYGAFLIIGYDDSCGGLKRVRVQNGVWFED